MTTRKTYSILVYPNITFAKDLEKDSYVVVLANIIRELNKIRGDLQWTILSPKFIKSLDFPNTKQIPIQLPTYPNQMRLHFNSSLLLQALDWPSNSYDIVFSNLPEHTLQLKNLFYNETNEEPVFIGYSHWTEFPEVTNYKKTVMDINILGLLEMIQCGINTEAQKKLLLKNASVHFNQEVCKSLDEIVRAIYIGAEEPVFEPIPELHTKVIVFNHRAHTYKNYPWFIKMMDKLYETRKDFKVWVPLAESLEREYMLIDKLDRTKYFGYLKNCYLGVCAKQTYAGWAVSATDGMSVGVPYIFADEDYYHELAGDKAMYYKTDDDFLKLVNRFLDEPDLQNMMSMESKNRFEELKWSVKIKDFNDMIELAISKLPILKQPTESYNKIKQIIDRTKGIPKKKLLKELNWGIRIKWSCYRNLLREKGYKISKDYYAPVV